MKTLASILLLLCQMWLMVAEPSLLWSHPGKPTNVSALAISPTLPIIAAGYQDGSIILFSEDSGQILGTFTNSSGGIVAIAIRADSKLVTWDEAQHLKVWSTADGTVILDRRLEFTLRPDIGQSAFSSDGLLLAVPGYEPNVRELLQIFETQEGKVARELGGPLRHPAFSPKNTYLASTLPNAEMYNVSLFRLADGNNIQNYSSVSDALPPLVFSFTEKILAIRKLGRIIDFWSVETGAYLGSLGDFDPSAIAELNSVGFSSDSKLFITINSSWTTRFWPISLLNLGPSFPHAPLPFSLTESVPITAAAFSPKNGRYVYGREDGTVKMFRIPIFITASRQAGAGLFIEWAGGDGSYRVESTPALPAAQWTVEIDQTIATAATIPLSDANKFLRIVNIPPPATP